MSQSIHPDRLHLDPKVDPKGRLAVEQLLAVNACEAVDYRESTASTNSLALADLAQSEGDFPPVPKLYVTDQQTAGRGRHGRRWVSTEATLTFSLVVPRPDPQHPGGQLIPLAVGMGIARYLEFEFAPMQVRLKWPNDVHVGGGKVAGILMETSSARPDRMVIGVGINVGQSPQLESNAESQSARGLAQVLGRSLQRYDLLNGMVIHILETIQALQTESDQMLHAFRQRCVLSGHRLSFQEGGQLAQGRCHGISNEGALIVETEHGIRHLQSGEANRIRQQSS